MSVRASLICLGKDKCRRNIDSGTNQGGQLQTTNRNSVIGKEGFDLGAGHKGGSVSLAYSPRG